MQSTIAQQPSVPSQACLVQHSAPDASVQQEDDSARPATSVAAVRQPGDSPNLSAPDASVQQADHSAPPSAQMARCSGQTAQHSPVRQLLLTRLKVLKMTHAKRALSAVITHPTAQQPQIAWTNPCVRSASWHQTQQQDPLVQHPVSSTANLMSQVPASQPSNGAGSSSCACSACCVRMPP